MGYDLSTWQMEGIVLRIAPADLNPGESTPTSVVPRQTCEDAGWANTVGMIHSHPRDERCRYYFPGTLVATSDARSFALPPYPVEQPPPLGAEGGAARWAW
jgi:hypothetical protein